MVLSTVDFFTPVVDDAYDWGRIAAANAFSDIYAMGGRPILAVNLVCWPRDLLPMSLAAEVLRGGLAVATEAGCPVAGGHSVDDPEPKYGMAVTGVGRADRLLRTDAGSPGLPLSLTKPLGIGVLNSRHKQTGEVFRRPSQPWSRSIVPPLRRRSPAAPVAPPTSRASVFSVICTSWLGPATSQRSSTPTRCPISTARVTPSMPDT